VLKTKIVADRRLKNCGWGLFWFVGKVFITEMAWFIPNFNTEIKYSFILKYITIDNTIYPPPVGATVSVVRWFGFDAGLGHGSHRVASPTNSVQMQQQKSTR